MSRGTPKVARLICSECDKPVNAELAKLAMRQRGQRTKAICNPCWETIWHGRTKKERETK